MIICPVCGEEGNKSEIECYGMCHDCEIDAFERGERENDFDISEVDPEKTCSRCKELEASEDSTIKGLCLNCHSELYERSDFE
jgi:hypothetical protein